MGYWLWVIALLSCCLTAAGQQLTVVELNVENLFDTQHDTLKNDYEFLPKGSYRWTRTRYWRKLNRVGQTIIAAGEEAPSQPPPKGGGEGAPTQSNLTPNPSPKGEGDFNGKDSWREEWMLPDLVGLCEVENDTCLRDLTKRSLLRKARYEYVMTDSPDQRGIDVALLYSPFSFQMLSSYALRIEPLKDMRPTRDILYACGQLISGDTLHVFVIHAPSRSGGEHATRPNRRLVAERLCGAVDSIRAISPDAYMLLMGDFNDYADSPALRLLEQHGLVNVSKGAHGSNGAKGTYRYQGDWGSLDQILLSESFAERNHSCVIYDAPFLLEEDKKYGGVKPRRNYLGPRYLNGFSDHLPLVLNIN